MLSAVHIPRKFYMPDWPEVLLAVGSVSQRMLISPVGLIVNHTRPRFRRTTWQHGWLKRPPLPIFFTRNGAPSRAWPKQIQISLEVVGWGLWSMFFFNIFSGALYLMVCPCRSTQSLHHKMTAKSIYGHLAIGQNYGASQLWNYGLITVILPFDIIYH